MRLALSRNGRTFYRLDLFPAEPPPFGFQGAPWQCLYQPFLPLTCSPDKGRSPSLRRGSSSPRLKPGVSLPTHKGTVFDER